MAQTRAGGGTPGRTTALAEAVAMHLHATIRADRVVVAKIEPIDAGPRPEEQEDFQILVTV